MRRAAGRVVSRVDVVAAVVLAAGTLAVSPGVAAAQCPEATPSYMDACGPTFAVPTWTDSGGWTDPSQYSTIRLADFNGDGRDELMARNGQGLEIWWFDTSVGQWRPQVDANGFPQALTDFRSPRPGETLATDWTKPQYYSTIQAADIDGQPGEEILARFSDGMRVYRYSPPAGGSSIDGGSWSLIGQGGPFSDAGGYGGDPSLYSTIRAARFSGGEPPMLFARAHPQTGRMTLAVYTWNQNGTWTPVPEPGQYGGVIDGFSDSSCGLPSCYLTIQAANVFPNDPDSAGSTNAVMGHNATGLAGYDLDSSFAGWNIPDSSTDLPYGPFSDVANSPDCPFTASSPDCLGSSPSYYETQSGANVDGQPGDELFARAIDGLRVKHWVPPYWPPNGQCCFKDSSFEPYATLTDLAGSGLVEVTAPGLWGSIRTGDINADGRDEVLALDGKALQAWSYDPGSDSWSRLQPSTAPALTDDWLTTPEYYSTIQVGDVDGDGRDDVIARGLYGIRTWFYNRRGTGGWERYLPEGYPAFPGTATTPGQPNTGQAAAYDTLNGLAQGLISTKTLRETWTAENAPDTLEATLERVQSGLPNPLVGNCSNQTVLEPPKYGSCTPPANSAFSAADWTTVVNEMLREAFFAEQVLDQIDDLKSLRQQLFISETAELPAIGDELGLQAAANTPASFDFQSFFAGGLGIAASLAGVAEPEVSAALWVASELASTIPAPSATANSSFQTTYAGLEDKFAAMVSETDKSIGVQSQVIRQDEGLMELVGELRSRGTWAMDTIGVGSAANQGFAAWVYSTLVPTIYDRYSITNCRNGFDYGTGTCQAPKGLGVIGGGQNFTMIGQRHQIDQFGAEQVPCVVLQDYSGSDDTCTWPKPPDDLLTRIWGPVDTTCSYVPGKSTSAWTFGSCSAGVDPATSIGDNSWGFPSYAGNPDPYNAPGGFSASASAAQADPPVPIVLGRPRQGRRRAVRGRAQVRANTILPRGMRLAGATIRLERLLFDRRGRGELARPHGRRAPRPLKLTLRRAARGRFTAATTGRRSVRVTLRRTGRRGRARLTLNIGAAAFRAPRACHALPASIAIETPPLYLETRLAIGKGRTRHSLRLEQHVRCVRDARGNVHRLVRVREPRYPSRRGLTVSLHGPRRVEPGTVVRYVARLHNQRRGRDRMRSSLWDVTLKHATRTTRIRELRRGHTRTVSFTRRVPRTTTRSRLCVTVVATAAGARAADARSCAAVAAAPRACPAERARHRRAAVACAARVVR